MPAGAVGGAVPALDEVRLEQLELAGLALDALLGLVGRDVAVLDDEPADPPEVDRHERRRRASRSAGRSDGRRQHEVVDDPRPEVVRGSGRPLAPRPSRAVVAEADDRRRRCRAWPAPRRPACRPRGEVQDRLGVVRREHPPPRVGEGQRAGVELREEPERVHLERRRVDDPLEAVGRDVVAAADRRASGRRAPTASRRIVPTTWRNIGPRSAPGSLGSWTFAPSRVWQTANPPVSADVVIQMSMPNLLTSSVQSSSVEVVPDEVAADPEVAADRLADAVPVQGPRQRVGDGVGDRAVVLVAGVERRHVVVAALEDRAGQQLDPFGDDRAQVGVDDDERLDLERRRDLEDRPQRRALAADAVDLGVGQADPLELVRRADEQDLLDVVGRLGLDDDAAGAVGRAGVGVDHHRPQVREVLDEAGLRRAHDVADRRGVLEARDADHDVGATEAGDLVPDRRRQSSRGHHPTVPPDRWARLAASAASRARRGPTHDRRPRGCLSGITQARGAVGDRPVGLLAREVARVGGLERHAG